MNDSRVKIGKDPKEVGMGGTVDEEPLQAHGQGMRIGTRVSIRVATINRWVLRAIKGVSKAALFCLGLLAMCALVVVATVLTAVMLAAAILPATAGRQKRDPELRHHQTGSRGNRHELRSGDKLLTQ